MSSPSSINRIHVNNSTGLSLNERFTAIQTFTNNNNQNSKSRSRYNSNGQVSFANRKFLQQLEKKHKMDTALKLKRRSLKNGLRGGRNRNVNALAFRLSPNGKIIKTRSITNVATMKADLVSPFALRRSNSNPNINGRLGMPRRIGRRRPSQIGISPQGGRRMRIRRNNNNVPGNNNNNGQRQMRGRSRSRNRSLQRANSNPNLNNNNKNQYQRQRSRSRSRNRANINMKNSRARSASQTRPVHSRLGIRQVPINRNNNNARNNINSRNRISRGRIMKRGNSTNAITRNNMNSNNIRRQGRARSRSRVRNGAVQQGGGQRGRSQSRGRNGPRRGGNNNQGRGGATTSRRGRSRSRGRGARGITRGNINGGAKKEDIKKEDLDKELDQYMASSNSDI